jgi:hypothetical protein
MNKLLLLPIWVEGLHHSTVRRWLQLLQPVRPIVHNAVWVLRDQGFNLHLILAGKPEYAKEKAEPADSPESTDNFKVPW